MRRKVELWTTLVAPGSSLDPRDVASRAVRLEQDGWTGATLADSQCLMGEVFAVLAWCAQATTRLKLGTGTSNPATRHPSVIASAAAVLQVVSNCRMCLGIGRGDSSLAYIGAPPVPVPYFERALAMIQAYLRGEDVPISDAAAMLASVPTGFDHLSVATAPEHSQLKWLAADFTKPDVEVAATGPKVIAVAARHADCISFALGANLDRLKWAIGVAREAIAKCGRDPDSVRLGAYIPLYPHSNIATARRLSQGMVASHSRFSVMNKKIVGPVTEAQRQNLERVASSYDMKSHGSATSQQSKALDSDFIDDFALVGDPTHCADRLLEIVELGISKFNLWTADTEGEPGESYILAATKVLPAVLAAA